MVRLRWVCIFVSAAGLATVALTSCGDSSPPLQPLRTFRDKGGIARCVAYSPDGRKIASCYDYPGGSQPQQGKEKEPAGEVKVWAADTGKEILAVNKDAFAMTIAFFLDGKSLAGAVGKTVRVWDMTTGKEKLAMKGHADEVRDLDIRRKGKFIASASLDGTIKIWDARTGGCLRTLKGQTNGVLHVSWSPDGKRVAGTGGDRDDRGEIRIWDWATEKQVLSLPHDNRLVGKALFSPDGKHLACSVAEKHKDSRPGRVKVWDIASNKLLFSRKMHSEDVTCLAYNPDGELLASASKDGSLIVIDALTGEVVADILPYRKGEPHSPITSLSFNPRRDNLATAFQDGSVKVWDIKGPIGNKFRRRR